MENKQIIISMNQETLASTLKTYEDIADNLDKQLDALDARIKKLEDKKQKLKKQADEVKSLINKLSGKEGITEAMNEIISKKPENEEIMNEAISENPELTSSPIAQNEEEIPVTVVEYKPNADSMGIDASGYNENFTWEEKINFILKNTPKALKRVDIAKILRALDKNMRDYTDEGMFSTLTPYLSKMARNNKIIRISDGTQGNYFLHPSWIENGEIKPEFKDNCPEKIEIIN